MRKKLSIILASIAGVCCFAVVLVAMISTGKITVSEGSPLYPVVQLFGSTQQTGGTAEGSTLEALNVTMANSVPDELYISPSDVSVYDGYAYTADTTGGKVYKTNLSNNSVVATYEAGKQVNSVKVVDGKVYIMQGQLAGDLVITDTSFKNTVTVEVGHTPNDIAVSGNKAYVANRFSNTVSVVDLNANTVIKTVDVGREPESMVLVGNEVYVASHLPEDDATSDLVSADIYVISTASDAVTDTIPMIDGTGSVKDICASPDGKQLYLSCIISRYTYPTTQLDRGWINTNAVAIVDVASKTNEVTVLIDDVDLGAANPWGPMITYKKMILG